MLTPTPSTHAEANIFSDQFKFTRELNHCDAYYFSYPFNRTAPWCVLFGNHNSKKTHHITWIYMDQVGIYKCQKFKLQMGEPVYFYVLKQENRTI